MPPENRLSASNGPATARGRRKRAVLIQAAREVFEEKGFEEARIAEISERAGSSYGSFYTYFESKHDIFRELFNAVNGEIFLSSRSGVPDTGTPTDRIRFATKRYLEAYRNNARILNVLEQFASRDEYIRDLLLQNRSIFLDRIIAGIERLQAEGLADTDIDLAVTADALGGMVENVARNWFLMGANYDEEVVLDTITRLWAQGIGLKYSK